MKRGTLVEAGVKIGTSIERRLCTVDRVWKRPDGQMALSGRFRRDDGQWTTHGRALRRPWSPTSKWPNRRQATRHAGAGR